MKTIQYHKNFKGKYHLKKRRTNKPIIKTNQLLVKVEFTSININDYEKYKGSQKFLSRLIKICQGSRPHPLGGEFCGTVVAVGKAVKRFKVDDCVMGMSNGFFPKGAWAEYVVCDEKRVVLKPNKLNKTQAAVIPLSGVATMAAINRLGLFPTKIRF